MLRAQTRGNSETQDVFVETITAVDLRSERSDESRALGRWEAAAGIHARSQAIELEISS